MEKHPRADDPFLHPLRDVLVDLFEEPSVEGLRRWVEVIGAAMHHDLEALRFSLSPEDRALATEYLLCEMMRPVMVLAALSGASNAENTAEKRAEFLALCRDWLEVVPSLRTAFQAIRDRQPNREVRTILSEAVGEQVVLLAPIPLDPDQHAN